MLPLFLSAFLALQLIKFFSCAQPCGLLQQAGYRNSHNCGNASADVCICICCYGLRISAEVAEEVLVVVMTMITAMACCSCSTHNFLSLYFKIFIRLIRIFSFIHVYIKQLRYLTFTQYI